MAINPVFIRPLDYPVNPTQIPMGAGLVSSLSDIGDQITRYRDQQEVGRLLQGAVDPKTGALDISKAATAIAVSGRDPTRYLNLLEAHSRAKEASDYRQQQLDIAREGRDIQRQQLETQGWTYEPPDALSGTPGGYRRIGPGGAFEFRPAPAPATPAPQSALPSAGPTLADFNPEEAPPYRVAGPPTPPPQPAATPAPAAAATPPTATAAPPATTAMQLPKDWEAGIATYPPGAQATVRGLLSYEQDPYKIQYRDKTQEQNFLLGLQTKFPGWNPQEFARREERRKQEEKKPTLSPEMAARLGIEGKFLVDMEDQTDAQGNLLPGVRTRIKNGELSGSYENAAMAQVYKGGPGQLRRIIDSGAEGLIRTLTGAGMNKEEAADYANRYKFSFFSNTRESLDKAEELADTLKVVQHAIETGKASPDELRKILGQRRPPLGSEKSQAKQVQNDTEASTLIGHAQEALRNGWKTREFLIDDLRRKGVPNPERYLQ